VQHEVAEVIMKKILVVLGFATLAACSKGAGEDKLKEFEGFRDKMCACTDAACADAVLEDWRKWREGTRDLKPTDEQKAKIKEIDRAFHDCEHKAGGGRP
jgi:hypothetical protein